MRAPLFASVLLAACAGSGGGFHEHDVVGEYRLQQGPEMWLEVVLLPAGECRVAACNWRFHVSRDARPGCWRIERGHLVLDVATGGLVHSARFDGLQLRRWSGHVYLVPPDHLSWFDRCGPMEEFCFARQDAPMIDYPQMEPVAPVAPAEGGARADGR